MEKAVAGEFPKLPKPRNCDGEEERAKGAKCDAATFFLAQDVGQVRAEHCENDSRKAVQNIVPPVYEVVKIIRITEQWANGINQNKYVQRVLDTELEKLFRDIRNEYVENGKCAHKRVVGVSVN